MFQPWIIVKAEPMHRYSKASRYTTSFSVNLMYRQAVLNWVEPYFELCRFLRISPKRLRFLRTFTNFVQISSGFIGLKQCGFRIHTCFCKQSKTLVQILAAILWLYFKIFHYINVLTKDGSNNTSHGLEQWLESVIYFFLSI